MTNDNVKTVPPAVGEFALQERARLLERISELEHQIESMKDGAHVPVENAKEIVKDAILEALFPCLMVCLVLMLPPSATAAASESRCIRVYEIAGDIMALKYDGGTSAEIDAIIKPQSGGISPTMVEMMIVDAFAAKTCTVETCMAQLNRFADSWYEACERGQVISKIEVRGDE